MVINILNVQEYIFMIKQNNNTLTLRPINSNLFK